MNRHDTHGPYKKQAGYTEALKAVMRGSDNYHDMPADRRHALDMIATKIGRILAGDYNHKDHWQDIAGYAERVLDE